MPTVYTQPETDEVETLAADVIRRWFGDLNEVDVKIGYLFAEAAPTDDEQEPPPALKHHGYPALAIVRIVSEKDRAAGMPDVMIYLDKLAWESKNERERMALLHHEYSHLILKRDKEGTPMVDDCGRPKFKMRPHDFTIGGFNVTAKLFTTDAPEVEAFAEIQGWMQAELKFG